MITRRASFAICSARSQASRKVISSYSIAISFGNCCDRAVSRVVETRIEKRDVHFARSRMPLGWLAAERALDYRLDVVHELYLSCVRQVVLRAVTLDWSTSPAPPTLRVSNSFCFPLSTPPTRAQVL